MPEDRVPDDRVAAPRSVVVGGGVAGLVAARALAAAGDRVLLLEGSPEVGGKLRLAEVAGVPVDVGAEAMLNRRPEGVDLARELGLPVVHPAVLGSRLLSRGALRPLPRSLMGVPLDLDDLAASGVLSEEGLARARAEVDLPAEREAGDPTIGDLVDRRFGPEVTDRLVEPLLGGVYAGAARAISARAALPQLVAVAGRGSVLAQAGDVVPSYDAPVFAGIEGGMGRLAGALVEGGGFEVRTGASVRGLARAGKGWRLVVGPTTGEEALEADRVVLAVPPAAAGRLLGEVAPAASRAVAEIETASLAVVTLAVRAADAGALEGCGSGFLVPPVEGRAIKAATFSFAKWDWVRAAGRGAGPDGSDLLLLRTSLGRAGEATRLRASDEELVAWSREDLADLVGLRADPVDAHVQRWGGGLPQYAPGHLDRVGRVRAAVAAQPGLAVCGAAYDGVGIPAVVASARLAVEALGEDPLPPGRAG